MKSKNAIPLTLTFDPDPGVSRDGVNLQFANPGEKIPLKIT
jgi:hypothetical protein